MGKKNSHWVQKVIGVFALVVVIGIVIASAGGGTSTAPKTGIPPVATARSVPVAPEPESIIPCTDGTQDSCVFYGACIQTESAGFPAASVGWLDCVCSFASSTWTPEEVLRLDPESMGIRMLDECGQP